MKSQTNKMQEGILNISDSAKSAVFKKRSHLDKQVIKGFDYARSLKYKIIVAHTCVKYL